MAQAKKNAGTSSRYYDAYRNFDQYYTNTSNAYAFKNAPSSAAYSSAARDDIPVYLPPREPMLQEEYDTAPRPNGPRRRRATRIRFLFKKDESVRIPFGLYAMLLFIFFGCAGMIYSLAITQDARVRVAGLRAQLKEAKELNSALALELNDSYDLELIEYIATTKLEMTKRKPYQEIHVSVPKASYIVQNNEKPEDKPQPTIVERIAGLILNR